MESNNDRLSALQAKLDKLNARWDSGYVLGPDRVLLNYERMVTAQQLGHESTCQNREHRSLPQALKARAQQAQQLSPPIGVGLWDCDTLLVPASSKDFKVWLWETLSFIVTDPVNDWQADIARPGTAVLLHKSVADKRALQVQPGVWVIDVDVRGIVFWCEDDWCYPDPDVVEDAGDIIMAVQKVLESALSFKIVPIGDTMSEVRRFCGTLQLVQQHDEARNMIIERWPTTKRLRSDTDVSFRGTTKRLNRGTEPESPLAASQSADTQATVEQSLEKQEQVGSQDEQQEQEQQANYTPEEVKLADALRKHMHPPMNDTGRLGPFIIKPTDIRAFSNWLAKTTESVQYEEQFRVKDGAVVLGPAEKLHTSDDYEASLLMRGTYTYPATTPGWSFSSTELRLPAITFHILRLDSERIQLIVEYTLDPVTQYVQNLLAKIGRTWPESSLFAPSERFSSAGGADETRATENDPAGATLTTRNINHRAAAASTWKPSPKGNPIHAANDWAFKMVTIDGEHPDDIAGEWEERRKQEYESLGYAYTRSMNPRKALLEMIRRREKRQSERTAG